MEFYADSIYASSAQPTGGSPPDDAPPALANLFRWLLTAGEAAKAEISSQAATQRNQPSTAAIDPPTTTRMPANQFRRLPDADDDATTNIEPEGPFIAALTSKKVPTTAHDVPESTPVVESTTVVISEATTGRQPVIASGVIAGICVGAAAALLIIAAFFIFWYVRRRRQKVASSSTKSLFAAKSSSKVQPNLWDDTFLYRDDTFVQQQQTSNYDSFDNLAAAIDTDYYIQSLEAAGPNDAKVSPRASVESAAARNPNSLSTFKAELHARY